MGTWNLLTESETNLGLERTERRRVPGGWLYRTSVRALRPAEEETVASRVVAKLVFVPKTGRPEP
jgi:hypothetical protein